MLCCCVCLCCLFVLVDCGIRRCDHFNLQSLKQTTQTNKQTNKSTTQTNKQTTDSTNKHTNKQTTDGTNKHKQTQSNTQTNKQQTAMEPSISVPIKTKPHTPLRPKLPTPRSSLARASLTSINDNVNTPQQSTPLPSIISPKTYISEFGRDLTGSGSSLNGSNMKKHREKHSHHRHRHHRHRSPNIRNEKGKKDMYGGVRFRKRIPRYDSEFEFWSA